MLTFLLALATASPVTPSPLFKYHLTTKTTSDVDLSAMGQGVQSFTITISAFVSVTLSDSANGRLVHVVIDSSAFDGGTAAAMLPPEMTADPKGTVFHMYVVNGKPSAAVMPSPMSVQAAQLTGAIGLLLPGLHGGKAGDSWTDTTRADTTITNSGVTANSSGTSITTWTLKTTEGGIQEIDGVSTGTTSVGGSQMQMDIQMNGTSHATAPTGGLARSASAKQVGQANMNIGGNAVPMKTTVEMAATQLP